MKISETLRLMAKEIEKQGFSPHFKVNGSCCFLMAEYRVGNNAKMERFLGRTMFMDDPDWYRLDTLKRERWNTKDAVAACLIAADIAQCEGK